MIVEYQVPLNVVSEVPLCREYYQLQGHQVNRSLAMPWQPCPSLNSKGYEIDLPGRPGRRPAGSRYGSPGPGPTDIATVQDKSDHRLPQHRDHGQSRGLTLHWFT